MGEQRQPPGRSMIHDPYVTFRFNAVIDYGRGSRVVSGFSEITGLAFETEVQTFREGGKNTHEQQLAGPTKFPSRLLLKRGLADGEALWSWYQDVMRHLIVRRNIAIVLLQNHYVPPNNSSNPDKARWRWVFHDACPVKWSGPEFRAGTAEVAFESIELVHKGLISSEHNGR
jgi:phage tail-like protein